MLRYAQLAHADLSNADLRSADLRGADLSYAVLRKADLSGANLSGSDAMFAVLSRARARRTIFRHADLRGASLRRAVLHEADLRHAILRHASLAEADVSGARLGGAEVYGTGAWNLTGEPADQRGLVIRPNRASPGITVDDLATAQFVFLLLTNAQIANVIESASSRVVLLLGRFTPRGRSVLEVLRSYLVERNFVPVLFDFARPAGRDLTETLISLANMSCFILADLTYPRSVPPELSHIVPYQRYVKVTLGRSGLGANQLMSGAHADYRKGTHRPGTLQAHEDFRENGDRPYRRTADDLLYGGDDRIDFDNPCDNLHAAWSHGLTDAYASAGCQVVVGFPCTAAHPDQPSTGPWRAFHDAAYEIADQDRFRYVLLEGEHVERVASDPGRPYSARIRYGSEGTIVSTVQTALQRKHFYEGRIDGDFGLRTLRAVIGFQRSAFGADAGDGIVGPQTAAALEATPWPSV